MRGRRGARRPNRPIYRLGVDLGGTKIEIVALDRHGRTLRRRRIPAPKADYRATVAAVVALVAETEAALGSRGTVGVGIPGSLSPKTGLVRNANSNWMNGRPFERDLAAALGRPVRVANDANCFALSEASDGAAAGAACVFGVILGTGVGAGIVIDGRVLLGANAIAGEWGHMPMPGLRATGSIEKCWCGQPGCVETFLSGPALELAYRRVSGAEATTAREIARRAARGENAATVTIESYCRRLARALAAVINVLDPDVIVLGGGVSNIAALYRRVPVLWKEHVFSDVITTRLVRNRHGDSGGVRGAAWLWPPPRP